MFRTITTSKMRLMGHAVRKGEMGKAMFCSENLEERYYLEDLDVDGRII
jgi:hypothetical protein